MARYWSLHVIAKLSLPEIKDIEKYCPMHHFSHLDDHINNIVIKLSQEFYFHCVIALNKETANMVLYYSHVVSTFKTYLFYSDFNFARCNL